MKTVYVWTLWIKQRWYRQRLHKEWAILSQKCIKHIVFRNNTKVWSTFRSTLLFNYIIKSHVKARPMASALDPKEIFCAELNNFISRFSFSKQSKKKKKKSQLHVKNRKWPWSPSQNDKSKERTLQFFMVMSQNTFTSTTFCRYHFPPRKQSHFSGWVSINNV